MTNSGQSAEIGNLAAKRIGSGHWLTLLAAFLGWMFDGFEMGLFPLVARPALLDLLGEENRANVEPWFSMMIAVFLIGAATGGVVFGWLGDRIGRVRAMTLSVLTYALFMGLCGVARTAEEVFVFRFISSLGMGGEWSLGVALVMEIWPNHARGMLAGLIGAAANVGFLLIAIIGLGLGMVIDSMEGWLLAIGLPQDWTSTLVAHSGWRLMMLIGAAPALLTFLIRLFVPESERWLHEKQQGSTSHWASRDLVGVLIGAAGPMAMIFVCSPRYDFSPTVRVFASVIGLAVALIGYTYPLLRYLQRSQASNRDPRHGVGPTMGRMLLGACLSGVALLGTWGAVQLAPAWADKLVEQEAADAGWDAAKAQAVRSEARAYSQILSAVGAIIGTMAGALIAHKVGRRITYTALCLLSLISAQLFFHLNNAYGLVFLVTVFFAGGLSASFYGWLPLYLPELFRTNVRATGQGFAFNFGRILAAVGALQTGNLIKAFGGSYPNACSVIVLVYFIGMAIIWLAPETRGKPLPE